MASKLPQVRANLEPLRNKRGPCGNCGKKPPAGEKFSVCSSCKATLYCSKACQKEHWPVHKVHCKTLRDCNELLKEVHKEPLDSDEEPYTTPIDHFVPFQDFCQMHETAISLIVVAMRYTHLDRPVDCAKDAMRIELAYREDHGGNPAKMFRISGAKFVSADSLLERFDAKDIPGIDDDKSKYRGRQSTEEFPIVGHLKVAYFYEKLARLSYVPMDYFEPEIEAMERGPARGRNLRSIEYLKREMEKGKVLVNMDPYDDSRLFVYGTMVLKGKMWKWKECPPGEWELRQPF